MHGKTAPSCGLHSQGGVRRGVRASGEENGILCVVYFEATEKTLKILRYYNPVTVVTKVSR